MLPNQFVLQLELNRNQLRSSTHLNNINNDNNNNNNNNSNNNIYNYNNYNFTFLEVQLFLFLSNIEPANVFSRYFSKQTFSNSDSILLFLFLILSNDFEIKYFLIFKLNKSN